jgi:general stress protein YciG
VRTDRVAHTAAELSQQLDCQSRIRAFSAHSRPGAPWHRRCTVLLDRTNEYKGVDVAKEDRGFASMDRSKQKEIASKGGKAAHQKGTAHEWTSEEARDAGRKGGLASHRRRREQKDGGDVQMVGVDAGILTSRAVEQAG